LREAYQYFCRGGAPETSAKGSGLLHLLREALATGGPYLLVLDGLERVQRQEDTGAYGQIEDPLLKGLLTRIAEGWGRTAVLVTSRFPLTDLQPFHGGGYRHLDVGGLGSEAARTLLRQRGVQGDDAVLHRLIDTYGAHALTLDHLGGLIGQFLGGDPGRAPELSGLEAASGDRQALRLARLLRAYEEHLPATELALLCRLCLLRRSITLKGITHLFLCQPEIHARTVRGLAYLIQAYWKADEYPLKSPDDLANSVSEAIGELLCAAPIAGPEEVFRQELRLIAEEVFQLRDVDSSELAHLYAGKDLDPPTDQLPLPESDRADLAECHRRFLELRRHPAMPYQDAPSAFEKLFPEEASAMKPPFILEKSFLELGFGAKSVQRIPRGEAADVLHAFVKVRRRLSYLTAKHFALRRVRALCRLLQEKFALAGPLARLEPAALHQVIDALVGRHLVLREADGSFSVHPAVRDHFYRVAIARESSAWHDILREQFISLVQRPGRGLPEDARTLDMIEEAIYHARQAGRIEEALRLFNDVLGGLRHLAWKLGEMGRGLRILRGFEPCPDRWALAWFLRALGEFEEAYRCNELPFFRADIRLLQGRLPQVAAEGEATRTAIAAFLMGQTSALPSQPLSCPIPRDQLLVYLGRFHQIRQSAALEEFYHEIGWEGDRARCQLVLAESAGRQGNPVFCRNHLELAAKWILHSGSVEHLCFMHLVRARLERACEAWETAQGALGEGLHLARHRGLGLYLVELLCEQAELFLARKDAVQAEPAAREALRLASHADCQFVWGAAEAGHVLGRALAVQQRVPEARAILDKTLGLRRRLGDPRAALTERLLAQLP
jgi:hypothetical protein